MARETYHIIADDLKMIRKSLQKFSSYDFAKDVAARKQRLGLSQNALAARAGVSHTMVGKWLHDGAKPNGKERYKQLGMALGMNARELDEFLMANSFPGLYIKNPLDIACLSVLSTSAGSESVVHDYRKYIQDKYPEDGVFLLKEPEETATTLLRKDFEQVKSVGSMDKWLWSNQKYFRSFGQTYIPHARLIQFINLFIIDQTIHEMVKCGKLPLPVEKLLYPLLRKEEIAVRRLRAKLIVLGLYENMTDDEIDTMLAIAKLLPITKPSAPIDHVILFALRRAHQRYPYFAICNADKVLGNLEQSGETEFRDLFLDKKRRAQELIKHYEKEKNEQDRLFEQNYTNYEDKNLLKYLRDIMDQLVETRELSAKDAHEYIMLMRTYQAEDKIGSEDF